LKFGLIPEIHLARIATHAHIRRRKRTGRDPRWNAHSDQLGVRPCCWSKVQGPNAPKLGEAFADLFFQRPGVSPNLVSDI
jgi:hypothetical protein